MRLQLLSPNDFADIINAACLDSFTVIKLAFPSYSVRFSLCFARSDGVFYARKLTSDPLHRRLLANTCCNLEFSDFVLAPICRPSGCVSSLPSNTLGRKGRARREMCSVLSCWGPAGMACVSSN